MYVPLQLLFQAPPCLSPANIVKFAVLFLQYKRELSSPTGEMVGKYFCNIEKHEIVKQITQKLLQIFNVTSQWSHLLSI